MRDKSKRVVFLASLAIALTAACFESAQAQVPDVPNTTKVTLRNNSDEYAVFFWVDNSQYGTAYSKRWVTIHLQNTTHRPYHLEVRADVNKNGNAVTVKDEYVDLFGMSEYTVTYP